MGVSPSAYYAHKQRPQPSPVQLAEAALVARSGLYGLSQVGLMVPPGCVLSCAAEAARPDEAWVGDISSIRTRQGFLYLAFVLDLAFRRVVGISMVPHLKTSLATYALREAIATRGDHVHGVVFHTDRGSQGGFNWWSQHLVMKEVCGECCGASGGDSCD